MDHSGLMRSFEAKLAKARRESLNPQEAHWATGYLQEAKERVRILLASGVVFGFAECEAGVSGWRVPCREQAVFKDGTALMALRDGAPWECSRYARERLSKGEELWLCLRLKAAPGRWSTGGAHSWCCCQGFEGKWAGPDEFWDEMSMEVARAQAALAVGEQRSLDACVRLDALAERSMLLEASDEVFLRSGPARL